jgi:hypothetical protein
MTATGEIPQFDRLVGEDEKERPSQAASAPISTGGFISRPNSYALKVKPHTIETPSGIARFLFETIGAEYAIKTILDPCSGRGALTKPWKSRRVIGYEIADDRDFFQCPDRIECDLVLCNPPYNSVGEYSHTLLPEKFLARIVEVVPPGTPIVLFTPMGLRLNCRSGARRYLWLRDECPDIMSIVSLPLDTFPYCLFHSEILFLNMPRLKAHYLLPQKYLDVAAR